MKNNPKGFIPVMLTPFKDNGAVDYDGLTRLTEFYLEAGASGMFANCLSSEMFELTEEERLKVTRRVVEICSGRVPVVSTGTFGGGIALQADFVKRIHDTGVHAVIVISNMLVGSEASDAAFEDKVATLLAATDRVPLGFYECPDPYKRVLTARQLGDFAATGRVIYHKDTCLDLEQIKAKLVATRAVDAFGLYDAYMVHAVESLQAGAAGLSCIQGNYFPELVVWLCTHYADAAMQEQIKLVQQFFIDHMDEMHQVYPIVAKYFLQKRGLPVTQFTRRKVGDFNETVLHHIDVLYTDYMKLFEKIDIPKVLL